VRLVWNNRQQACLPHQPNGTKAIENVVRASTPNGTAADPMIGKAIHNTAAQMCRYGQGSPVELAVFAGGAARMVGGVVPGVLEEIDADRPGRGGV
jgi:hypothetical protein